MAAPPRWTDKAWREAHPEFLLYPPDPKRGTLEQLQKSHAATNKELRAKRGRAMAKVAKRRRRNHMIAEREQIAAEMQAQQDAANRANTSRYAAQISALADLGQGTRMRIRQGANRQMSRALQALTSRGVGGATVVGSMAKRAGEAAALGHAELADNLARARIGVHGAVSDVGPDMRPLQSASAALGSALYRRQPPGPVPAPAAPVPNQPPRQKSPLLRAFQNVGGAFGNLSRFLRNSF